MLRSGEGVEAESASLHFDRPVYPRRLKHNTVAEGGVADGRSLRQDPFSDSCPTALSRRVAALWHSPGRRSGLRRAGRNHSDRWSRLAYLPMNSIVCTNAAGVTLNKPV